MEPYGFVYKTENIITYGTYIGQTTRLQDSNYIGSGIYLKRAVQKYGRNNFEREILCYCKDQLDLDHKERLYIALLKPTYNIANGGIGLGKHSQETLIKMSESAKNSIYSRNHIKKLIDMHTGTSHTDEHCYKISRALIGRKRPVRTAEWSAKISASLKGVSLEAQYVSVRCIEDNIEFKSMIDAAAYVKGVKSHICECCKGKLSTYRGYHWEYVNV